MRSIGRAILLCLVVWTLGLALGVFVYLMWLFRGLSVQNWWRLMKRNPGGKVIVANHPSIQETYVLPALFVPLSLFMPWRVPYSTPDKANFFDRWWWAWARIRMIPVPRGKDCRRELPAVVEKMVEALRRGRTIVLFPEGGRTRSGAHHIHSLNKKGRIRPLHSAVITRLVESSPDVVFQPVWIDRVDDDRVDIKGRPDSWQKMEIRVGRPIRFNSGVTGSAVEHELARALLRQADGFDL